MVRTCSEEGASGTHPLVLNEEYMNRLEGKTIIVTGAAKGQGRQEALDLVAQGAIVVATEVDDSSAELLQAAGNGNIHFIKHDVSKEEDWCRVVELAVRLGGVHGLVNNAGIYRPNPRDGQFRYSFDRTTQSWQFAL
jgi:Dehydrogenases with different specificities (related to short-chain alcohol dehydrogenases)